MKDFKQNTINEDDISDNSFQVLMVDGFLDRSAQNSSEHSIEPDDNDKSYEYDDDVEGNENQQIKEQNDKLSSFSNDNSRDDESNKNV